MLELRHISKTFYPGTVHEKTALQDLSLTGALPLTADASCSTDRS